jgi:rhamnosyltransferase
MNPTLAFVIAHFHEEGKVATDLFNLVEYLSKLTKKIVFVSTGISDTEIIRLSPFAKVIRRENFGYDFWSYKVGIDALGDKSKLKRLVIFNSSFITLNPHLLMSQFLTSVGDPLVKGLTISNQHERHIQSYLVSFENKALINSPPFIDWWAQMEPISDKFEVVSRYEIGMSNWFAKDGIPLMATYEPTYEELLIAMARAIGNRQVLISDVKEKIIRLNLDLARELNPSHYLWDFIFHHFNILKIDLLKNNPTDQRLDSLNKLDASMHALISEAIS